MKIKLIAKDSVLTIKAADPRISNTLQFNIVRKKMPKLIWTDSTGTKNFGTEASASVSMKDNLVTGNIYFTFEDLEGTMPSLGEFNMSVRNPSGKEQSIGAALMGKVIGLTLIDSEEGVYIVTVSYGSQTIVFTVTAEAGEVEEPEEPEDTEFPPKEEDIEGELLGLCAIPNKFWDDGYTTFKDSFCGINADCFCAENSPLNRGEYQQFQYIGDRLVYNLPLEELDRTHTFQPLFNAGAEKQENSGSSPMLYAYTSTTGKEDFFNDDIDDDTIIGALYVDDGTGVGQFGSSPLAGGNPEGVIEPSNALFGSITDRGGMVLQPKGHYKSLIKDKWYTIKTSNGTKYYKCVESNRVYLRLKTKSEWVVNE